MKAFLTFLLVFTGALCLPIDNSVPNSNTTLSKRYFSVPPRPANPETAPKIGYPWPPNSDGRQSIRYCFRDQKSFRNLGRLFMGPVIQKWQTALAPHSALAIVPDPRCVTTPGGPPDRFADEVASDGNLFDALVISDITQAGNGQRSEGASVASSIITDSGNSRKVNPDIPVPGSGSVSTVGYDPCRGDEIDEYPNTMKIKNSVWDTEYEKAILMRSMVHELGHVIGLEHEHQRPDRDHYIRVDFKNLEGWREAYEEVKEATAKEEPTFAGKSPEQRMVLLTSDFGLAEEFDFEEAGDFIRAPRFGNEEMASYQASRTYDYDSIMHYGSYASAVAGDTGELKDAVMTRRDQTGARAEIFQGGNEDARLAGPSPMDVARVKQLYPLNQGQASGSGSQSGRSA
ncbi:hypothetical protein AC579_6745 [Pseudocercospora musae]|uniref:Metalloendopeptidase n=1 Tax=Pseudocercospora musae TaxID=113226 RepID=A0A139I558_9PEZI|nr:hypothetical protein AC579_6745 [Pseudocercospora musae]